MMREKIGNTPLEQAFYQHAGNIAKELHLIAQLAFERPSLKTRIKRRIKAWVLRWLD